jgi:serine phosphatase RsbU (regulator of sigma subunit)
MSKLRNIALAPSGLTAPDPFEWYVSETRLFDSCTIIEPPVRLGPFATQEECRDLLHSMKQISRFSNSNLKVCKNRRRRETRVKIELPLEVWLSATSEKAECCHTVDISTSGLRLSGFKTQPQPGDILEIHCGPRKARFRVVWIGSPHTAAEGQVGVERLAGEANILDLDVSELHEDEPLLQELDVARAVQKKLFPQEVPPLHTLDFAGNCIQAHSVGGDYYDCFPLAGGEVAFVLADISGKGVAAALLMANLQGSLRSQAPVSSKDLPVWLTSVNRHFYMHTETERYATLFLACYNDGLRQLHYINCGHNPPLLLRQSGVVERLNATATVLGAFRDWECSVAKTQLEAGDVLCCYTDGITESIGRNGDEFGQRRLLQSVRENRELEASSLLRRVEKTVEHFRVGEQEDDLTLVIARAR